MGMMHCTIVFFQKTKGVLTREAKRWVTCVCLTALLQDTSDPQIQRWQRSGNWCILPKDWKCDVTFDWFMWTLMSTNLRYDVYTGRRNLPIQILTYRNIPVSRILNSFCVQVVHVLSHQAHTIISVPYQWWLMNPLWFLVFVHLQLLNLPSLFTFYSLHYQSWVPLSLLLSLLESAGNYVFGRVSVCIHVCIRPSINGSSHIWLEPLD